MTKRFIKNIIKSSIKKKLASKKVAPKKKLPNFEQILEKGILNTVVDIGNNETKSQEPSIIKVPEDDKLQKIREYILNKTDIPIEALDYILTYIVKHHYVNADIGIIDAVIKHANEIHQKLVASYKLSMNIPNTPGWVEFILNNQRPDQEKLV